MENLAFDINGCGALNDAMLNTMPISCSCWNRNFQPITCNDEAVRMHKLQSRRQYLDCFRQLFPEYQPNGESSADLARAQLQKAFDEGCARYELTYQTINGEPIPCEIILKRLEFKGETIVACYALDLRERLSNSVNWGEADERTRIMLDATPLAATFWDSDLTRTDCNLESVKLFNLGSKEEYLERFYELSPETQPCGTPSRELAEIYLQQAFNEGYVQAEWIHQTLSGQPIPTALTLVRVKYKDTFIVASYIRDLRRLKASMEKTREADERTRIMLDATPLAATFWNSDLERTDCNLASVKLFNLGSKEDYLKRFYELSPETQPCGTPSRELAEIYLRQAFEEGYVQAEWIHQTLDGQPIPSEMVLVRVKYKDTFIVASYIRDLRQLKASMEKTREADERTRIMLDATPLCCTLTNGQGQLFDCNEETLKLFGVKSKEEYIARFYDLRPQYQPDGRKTFDVVWDAAMQAKTEGYAKIELMHQKLDGTPIPTEMTLVKVYLHGQAIIAGYCRDLTEIKAYMAKIREADERTQIMLDATPLCCNLFDRRGRLIDCNLEAVNLFGLTSKNDYLDLFYELSPQTQPNGSNSAIKMRENIDRAFAEGYCRFEWMHHTLNGELIPSEVILVKVKYRGADIVAGYIRDLRELKIMLKEMHKAQEDLHLALGIAEESTRAKSEFLATMSHEIRTPMNGVLGLLHLVLQTGLTAKQRDYLEKTEVSAQNLLRIINDILDFSKIEAGKMDMESVEFHMKDLLNEISALFEPSVKAKNLTFTINTAHNLPLTLIGDPLRLKQVLVNLIGNAVKFTRKGGVNVEIALLRHDIEHYWLKFMVKDNGIGLTKEQLQNLFTPFNQVDSSITRRYGGTGLGLAIAKNLVGLMHGDIWAESIYGQGTEFYFTACFSVAAADISYIVKKPACDTPGDIQLLKALINERPVKVLLVEDNEINQLIALELLDMAGISVDVAHHGAEALTLLNDTAYDLVLLDVQMPVMDGLTCAQIIRSQHKFKHLPVIGMSAYAMTGDCEKSLNAGMNDYITKPINPAILYKTLYKWLEKAGRTTAADAVNRM